MAEIKSVKMCDMPLSVAISALKGLNPGKVELRNDYLWGMILVTEEPKNLVYPEGWYYAKGNYRNKHTSTTGIYKEIPMYTKYGEPWKISAKYCTLNI